jgi:hypothetical protein
MKLIQYHSLVEDSCKKTIGAETEEELIREIKNIKDNLENSKLSTYHAVGTKIKGFYGKNYGKNEMAKIARFIDLSTSTVYKIVQFADKYCWQDVEEISAGAFQLSWHRLRDNLSLQKEEVLRVYRASHNMAEFKRKAIQLRRTLKTNQEAEQEANDKVNGLEGSEQICPGVLNLPVQDSNRNLSETIQNLQTEITKLQSEIEQKNRELDSLRMDLASRKVDFMTRFPEMLWDLDNEALVRLDSLLLEEIKRREIKENAEETVQICTINES